MFIKIFHLSLLLFLMVSLKAQNYNYSEYLFPDLTVKGFGLSGNSFGNSFYIQDSNRLSGNVYLNAGYFLIENTKQKQKFVQYVSDIFYNRKNVPLTLFGLPEKEFGFNFSSYGEQRLFKGVDKKGKQKFIEFDHVIHLDYFHQQFQNNTNPPVIREDLNTIQSWVALPIKLGKGRLEPLAGLPVAEFLADDLMEAGLLSSPFTQDQLFQLAQKMVEVENARVFDLRRRNIYRLKELSTWLENHGIPLGIETFTILNDNYNFAFAGIRNQGKQQSIGIIPIFSIETRNSTKWTPGYGLGIQYDWVKQKNISKNLHKTWRASGSFYLMELDQVRNQSILHARMQHEITYVPNSRTLLNLSPFLSVMHLDMENFASLTGLSGSASYFVNNRLRIMGNLVANYFFNPLISSSITLPAMIMSPFYESGFYRGISNNIPIYQSFHEKFNFSGGISFSYFFY